LTTETATAFSGAQWFLNAYERVDTMNFNE
jgi:hypothetical protein